MTNEERRKYILDQITNSPIPLTGTELARLTNVSRQVIVQDIALIRAKGFGILSTNKGYVVEKSSVSTVFKTVHTDSQVQEELTTIVDNGGIVKDVFVFHKVYGKVCGVLNIKSRLDIQKFIDGINSGKSTLLKNVTSNYHYHTVIAESEENLKVIEEMLKQKGFLAPLQDWEKENDAWKISG